MSKDLKDIDLSAAPQVLSQFGKHILRYRILLFVVFVALIYGFIGFRIFVLSDPNTDVSDVDSEVTSLTPHIDVRVADQLQNLKDNSVNVQTLFDEARKNPFAE